MQPSKASQLENILFLKVREQGQDLSQGLNRPVVDRNLGPDVLPLDLHCQFLSDGAMQLHKGGLLPVQQFELLYGEPNTVQSPELVMVATAAFSRANSFLQTSRCQGRPLWPAAGLRWSHSDASTAPLDLGGAPLLDQNSLRGTTFLAVR